MFVIPFGDENEPSSLCNLIAIRIDPPSLISNHLPDCTPTVAKPREQFITDWRFIRTEINHLLEEQITEPSKSPWLTYWLLPMNGKNTEWWLITTRK